MKLRTFFKISISNVPEVVAAPEKHSDTSLHVRMLIINILMSMTGERDMFLEAIGYLSDPAMSTFLNPSTDESVQLSRMCSAVTAILYCTSCNKFVVLRGKLSVLRRSEYRAQFNCSHDLHKW